jgi:hypothetical protein
VLWRSSAPVRLSSERRSAACERPVVVGAQPRRGP